MNICFLFFVNKGVNMVRPDGTSNTGIGGPCPAGYYCIERTEDPTPCPNTTYRDTIGATALVDCHLCPNGKYCGTTNLTAGEGDCDPGFYCLRGNSVPNPAGVYPQAYLFKK